jgi:hypothetical protein
VEVFLPRTGISLSDLKLRLRLYSACLAAVQGTDYIQFRLAVDRAFFSLCDEEEEDRIDAWYFDYLDRTDFGFETYEPDADKIPYLLTVYQRLRETGSAFKDFSVDTLDGPTAYTEAFSGSRPRASEVGDWLKRDPDHSEPLNGNYAEELVSFRKAFLRQAELRKLEEGSNAVNRTLLQEELINKDTFLSEGFVDGDGRMQFADDE